MEFWVWFLKEREKEREERERERERDSKEKEIIDTFQIIQNSITVIPSTIIYFCVEKERERAS